MAGMGLLRWVILIGLVEYNIRVIGSFPDFVKNHQAVGFPSASYALGMVMPPPSATTI